VRTPANYLFKVGGVTRRHILTSPAKPPLSARRRLKVARHTRSQCPANIFLVQISFVQIQAVGAARTASNKRSYHTCCVVCIWYNWLFIRFIIESRWKN